MKRKYLWIVVGLIIIIILGSYFYPKFKESFIKEASIKLPTNSEESIDIEKVIYSSYNYEESPILVGYVEERDEGLYEGELERKSYTSESPGEIKIIYEGILYFSDKEDIQSGVYWMETSMKQIVDNIDDPPMEKEIVIKFMDRFYKGTLEVDFARGNVEGNKFYYYGKLHYDNTLEEEDITK